MVVAYLTINEPDRRRELLELAEHYARSTCTPPISQDNHIDRK